MPEEWRTSATIHVELTPSPGEEAKDPGGSPPQYTKQEGPGVGQEQGVGEGEGGVTPAGGLEGAGGGALWQQELVEETGGSFDEGSNDTGGGTEPSAAGAGGGGRGLEARFGVGPA